jgi:hypothetical protein
MHTDSGGLTQAKRAKNDAEDFHFAAFMRDMAVM